MNRRKYMLVAGGAISISGCSGSPEDQSTPEEDPDQTSNENEDNNQEEQTEEGDDQTEPAEFDFEIVEAPEVIKPEQSFDIEIVVENVGGTEGTTEFVTTISGQTSSEELKLQSGEREELIFSFDEISEAGSYSVSVEADDSQETYEFDVAEVETNTEIDYNDTMFVGETEEVTVLVENTGRVNVSTTILFELFSVEDERDVSVSPGESEELIFNFEVPGGTRSSVLSIANEAVEEVWTYDVDLVEYTEVIDVTLLSRDDTDCDGIAQRYASPEWEFEVSTDVNLGDRESMNLEVEFTDGEGRVTGFAILSPRVPRPDAPTVILTGTDNWPERECPGWMAIPEGLDNGGSVELVDVSFE